MTAAPRVLFLTGDEVGSTLWRVWSVCKALQERGFVAVWCHKDQSDAVLPLLAAGVFDLVITPRIVWPQAEIGDRWMRAIHGAGSAVCYECDDDVWSERIVQRQMATFATEAAKGETQLEWERNERLRLLKECDGVTVSSRWLKSIAQQHTDKPVIVIENAIDVPWFRRTLRGCGRIPELQGKLTVGWAGGTRQDADLAPLVQVWPRLARRYPEVQFVIQGHMPAKLIEVMPPEQLHTLPWLPLEEYPRGLLNFDIGCCSVFPSVFNSAKTPIKWFEFSLAGAACVVSPWLYGPVVTNGEDALVADTAEEWEAALERLIVDSELRRRLNRAARYAVVTRHSLKNNLMNWPVAWAEIVEDFRARRAVPKILIAR